MNNQLVFFLNKTRSGDLWVGHEFSFEEFKELMDRKTEMMEFADARVRMAFVTVDNCCQVESSTYCWIEFDKCGKVSHKWSIPFRPLTENSNSIDADKLPEAYIWNPEGDDIQLVENAVKGHLMGLIDEAG